MGSAGSPRTHEVVRVHADVSGNLAKQRRSNVSAFVERHCCSAAICMPELFVSTTLTDFDET
jgi:hypothetical protein